MTGRDLISASLRKIGALASSETMDSDVATDSFAELNRMISSWSNERLMIYDVVRESVVLTPGTAAYTMGTGGTYSATRPLKIIQALIRLTTSPAIEMPIRILTLGEWASISAKDITTTIPTDMYVGDAFPLTTITLYPVPSAAYSLILWSWKPLTALSTIDTTISLPPGYEDALIYNLAIRLAPEYGKQVPDVVAMTAIESKAAIKRVNHDPQVLTVDTGLLTRKGFNWITGGYA